MAHRMVVVRIGRLAEPSNRFGIVESDTLSGLIRHPKIVHRRRIASVRGLGVPADRFPIVLGDAVPPRIHETKIGHSDSQPAWAAFV